jgi:protein phosphatase 1 regulatory subunit 11
MPPAQTTQPESGSRTLTQTSTPARGTENNDAGPSEPVGVLKLRGGPSRRQKVVWSEETVDNEGMGKKKSKSKWGYITGEIREMELTRLSLLYLP